MYLCKKMNYNTIIWDWNGTLLNDVQIGRASCRESVQIPVVAASLKKQKKEKKNKKQKQTNTPKVQQI